MKVLVVVGFGLLHVPPHPDERGQCGPHQRHKRQHQEAVQYFDQHRFQGYQKTAVRPVALGAIENDDSPFRNFVCRAHFTDIAFSTSSAVRGSPALSRTSLPSESTQKMSSMRTPRFSSGM